MLDRIPWLAPELVETPERPKLECDKWSFGTTLWEIFNCGETPLQGWDLEMAGALLSLPRSDDTVNCKEKPPKWLTKPRLCKTLHFLFQKLQFYKKYQQLPPFQWTELADLVSQCMTYQPEFRPSCRSIIRQLNSLITSGIAPVTKMSFYWLRLFSQNIQLSRPQPCTPCFGFSLPYCLHLPHSVVCLSVYLGSCFVSSLWLVLPLLCEYLFCVPGVFQD